MRCSVATTCSAGPGRREYHMVCASLRATTSPSFLSLARCCDSADWLSAGRWLCMLPTVRSPSVSKHRTRRRRGFASARSRAAASSACSSSPDASRSRIFSNVSMSRPCGPEEEGFAPPAFGCADARSPPRSGRVAWGGLRVSGITIRPSGSMCRCGSARRNTATG